jgi:hypothetical protein
MQTAYILQSQQEVEENNEKYRQLFEPQQTKKTNES